MESLLEKKISTTHSTRTQSIKGVGGSRSTPHWLHEHDAIKKVVVENVEDAWSLDHPKFEGEIWT